MHGYLIMMGSRFGRSRGMQIAAWLVFCFCIGVIFTGMMVGPSKDSVAQTAAQEEQHLDGDQQDAAPIGEEGEVAPKERELEPNDDALQGESGDQGNAGEAGEAATDAVANGDQAKEQAQQPAFTRKIGEGSASTILERLVSLFGIVFFIGLAWVFSNNRKAVNWKLVGVGVTMQLAFAAVIFFVPGGEYAFDAATQAVASLLEFTSQGSSFIFESFVTNQWEPALINFAFAVLPTIIFFSSLMTILYHLGVMHRIVHVFAMVMQKAMNTSGAESLSAAANIFVGQTEAPLVVKPYVNDMTMSEIMTVMTGGFATVAGGVMAIYVGMLQDVFPDIAGHLIAASVMSAPAALVIGKIMWPETETPETMGELEMNFEKEDVNVLDAASRGAAEGLTLALNVGAMLLAFLALIGLVNALIAWPQSLFMTDPLTLQQLLGYIFSPIAWVMGVPWVDSVHIGQLLGTKMVVNELVGYAELQKMLGDPEIQLQDRSVIIATYALCGFANFGSIGIQLGGIGGIAPDRKHDLAKVAFRAMIAGTIAAFMTATIAGVLV